MSTLMSRTKAIEDNTKPWKPYPWLCIHVSCLVYKEFGLCWNSVVLVVKRKNFWTFGIVCIYDCLSVATCIYICIVFKCTCGCTVHLFLCLHELYVQVVCVWVNVHLGFAFWRWFIYTCMGMPWQTNMKTTMKTVYFRPIWHNSFSQYWNPYWKLVWFFRQQLLSHCHGEHFLLPPWPRAPDQ